MEVLVGKWISDDLNGVAGRHGSVYFLTTSHNPPTVLNNVSVIRTLSGYGCPDPILSFAGLTETHYAIELHAINLPIRQRDG
jgi:hypothetical protein